MLSPLGPLVCGRGKDREVTRIAVIDDDRDFLSLIADALSDVGWETVTCCEASRAISVVKEAQPDVILLDLRFHSLEDGWDVLTALQLHPRLHQIPVVVCSGAAEDLQDNMDWLKSHGMRTLAKPFSLDDLYLVLAASLPVAEEAAAVGK